VRKEAIRIEKVIVHILDALSGLPALSDTPLEFGSELADFLKEHISNIMSKDDVKECDFYQQESQVYHMMIQYAKEHFVEISKDLANGLYTIMNANVDIPSADLFVVQFRCDEITYLGILKMNYKESYTHRTAQSEEGNANQIIRHKAILPSEKQRLTEAAVIRLNDYKIFLIEKKYEVNGEKLNYFSQLFLKCHGNMSHKSKLSCVVKAVDHVQEEFVQDDKRYEEALRAKEIIGQELIEQGGFIVEDLAEKLFQENVAMKTAFQDKIEQYDLVKQEVSPKNEGTVKKYQTQVLTTDSGIEIKIPMADYQNPGKVEFITNQDGSVSVLIRNIGHLRARL